MFIYFYLILTKILYQSFFFSSEKCSQIFTTLVTNGVTTTKFYLNQLHISLSVKNIKVIGTVHN